MSGCEITRLTSQHLNLPWNFVMHGFLYPSAFPGYSHVLHPRPVSLHSLRRCPIAPDSCLAKWAYNRGDLAASSFHKLPCPGSTWGNRNLPSEADSSMESISKLLCFGSLRSVFPGHACPHHKVISCALSVRGNLRQESFWPQMSLSQELSVLKTCNRKTLLRFRIAKCKSQAAASFAEKPTLETLTGG